MASHWSVSSLGHFLTGCILFRQALLMPVTWIVFLCSFRVAGLKMTKDFVSFWIYFCTGKGEWPSVIILHRDLQFAWRCLLKHMHVRVCVHTQTFIKFAAHGCVHSFLHLLFYCIYKSLCLHKTRIFFCFLFLLFCYYSSIIYFEIKYYNISNIVSFHSGLLWLVGGLLSFYMKF